MMEIIYVLIGVVGGVIGGMGMGGGTLLIPLLTTFDLVSQKSAQAINLVAFVPMSVVAVILHAKNKLIEYRYLWLSLPALASSIAASLLALSSPTPVLRIGFGVFLVALGVFQLVSAICKRVASNKQKKRE